MLDLGTARDELLAVVRKKQERFELSSQVSDDYFEPGMMEYLDKYHGEYDYDKETIVIRTEVKGLRYENRSVRLNEVNVGDQLQIVRDEQNTFNANNFKVTNMSGEDMGTLDAELCNALAPLYDSGYARITDANVSYIEKLLERSRYAKQGVLFIEIHIKLIRI